MKLLPTWINKLAKCSETLVQLNTRLIWGLHLLKDWWEIKCWTKNTEVETPLGFKLTAGYHPAYDPMRTREFESEETAIIADLLPRVDVFVDIGANLGYYTCLALQNGRSVIAFEPQQQNLRCLF